MNTTTFHDFFQGPALGFLMRAIDTALEEDGPDLTSLAVFGPAAPARAEIVAKQDAVAAGLPIGPLVLDAVTPGAGAGMRLCAADGQAVRPGQVVAEIHGPASTLLRAERVILNFLTHLSGIATLTRAYADALRGSRTTLLDTRKTLPGLRHVQKYAVLMGGGKNHRLSLGDMLMLKDNHIDQAGGIAPAVARLRAAYRPCPPIEVECRTLGEVREAAALGVARIMLDNMAPGALAEALALVPEGTQTEVSGGVSLDTLAAIAQAGPDFVSVGRLTHSAPAADFSMRIHIPGRPQ
ncbi:carboxylating nicotinate-nucleotide diphosphorylase [Desulfocurvus sp.]|jgi:nicotinate-nucleotide pyrophosphorylase (carboxylating)|uniref:carboxylating nicotinate-nucleotide diphosphorylase n=1 Tax=Desulfocurvus sp. TaxID=2871698 RepID=UPI0025C458A2|nr:carboxylating nicotinate-nucleotide diphosphorylase [Desulfocurvus sp.]MCK9240044.1 carboxylating nicotinate-nucleotide diphosphorylase [Desulfocurvus sp.]